MQSSNEEQVLAELAQGDLGVFPDLLLLIISPDSLRHVVRFAGHEPLEGFHILNEVEANSLSGSLHEVLEVGEHSFGLVLLLK